MFFRTIAKAKSWKQRQITKANSRRRFRLPFVERLEARKVLATGDLDLTFGGTGSVISDFFDSTTAVKAQATAVAVQADGKIVLVGSENSPSRVVVVRYNADNSLDTTFDGDGKFFSTGVLFNGVGVGIQSDGKIVVAGFTGLDFAVLRLNTNGTIDTSFDGDGFITIHFANSNVATPTGLLIQPDDKILVIGSVSTNIPFQPTQIRMGVTRLNSDGTPDLSFDGDGQQTVPVNGVSVPHAIALDSRDGSIVLGGSNDLFGDASNFAVARMLSDGTLDSGFDGDGFAIFNFGNLIQSSAAGVVVQPDGKIVLGGTVAEDNIGIVFGNTNFGLVRFNLNGTPDSGFGTNNRVVKSLTTGILPISGAPPAQDIGYGLALQSDGKLLLVGESPALPGAQGDSLFPYVVLRYTAAGTLDTTFDGDGVLLSDIHPLRADVSRAIALQPDGRFVLAGYTGYGRFNAFSTARYNSDGTLDTSFNGDGKATTGETTDSYVTEFNDEPRGVVVQSDGKIVVGGTSWNDFDNFASAHDFSLVRYKPDGTLDPAFGVNGHVFAGFDFFSEDYIHALKLQSDGKILAVGTSRVAGKYYFAAMRFNTDGTLDTSFDGDGKLLTAIPNANNQSAAIATDCFIQSDGKIVVVGGSATNLASNSFVLTLARYNVNGSLDTSFDSDGIVVTTIAGFVDSQIYEDSLPRIAVDSQSRIVVSLPYGVRRFLSNGSVDASFATNAIGGLRTIKGLFILPDDRILVGGDVQFSSFYIARLKTTGELDDSFNGFGEAFTFVGGFSRGRALAVQPDGKPILIGTVSTTNGDGIAVVRYTTAGALDTSFSDDGTVTFLTLSELYNTYAMDAALQPDGKIVFVGTNNINQGKFETVRLDNDAAAVPTLSISDVSLTEGNGGPKAFTFTVTLSGNPSSNVTVTVSTANGTTNPATTADGDYQAIVNQVMTFTPGGALTQTVTVNVTGDTKFERDETLFVNLSSATGATIADGQGLGTILNDDLAPTLTVTGGSVLEGNVTADDRKVAFTISLSAASGVDVTGSAATSSGTATQGIDFVTADGVAFSIPAGQTQAVVNVSVIEDTTVEPDEQFSLTASVTDRSSVNNETGSAIGQGTILNDDSAQGLTLSINDVSLPEGNSGSKAFTFTVTLSGNPSSNVTVTVNTANGTTNPATTIDGDYQAIANQVLTFTPGGSLTQTVTVNVTGDTKFERDETFFVNLSSATGVTIADGQGLGTILNDDAAPILTVSGGSVLEGNVAADDRKVPFTLFLSAPSGIDVSGIVTTASGSATEGVDFVTADGIAFSIPAGQTQAVVNVSVIEDTTVESDEQFSLTATVADRSSVNNETGSAIGQGTILNDDSIPVLSINDVSLTEGNSGSKAFTFTVTLSGNPSSNVTVTANTANGTTNPTATADGDYQAIANQVLTFTPGGALTKTVTVNVTGDTKFERDETFFVNLSSATGATIADGQGLGTILNDDLAPILTVTGGSVLEGNVTVDDRKVSFTISLSAASGVDVSGTLATDSGTATEGVDFVIADGTAFSIPAGQTQTVVSVSVLEDTEVEPDEQFSLTATVNDATTVRNAGGKATGQGTIFNDEFAVGTSPPLIIGTEAHKVSQPMVKVIYADGTSLKFRAYEQNYRGGVRVAVGDVTGDGVPEIITVPGRQHAPLVKVFTLQGQELFRFLAYAANFTGGAYVAVGDVIGASDTLADIVVVPSREGKDVKGLVNGGTEVRVFQNISRSELNPVPGLPYFASSATKTFQAFAAKTVGNVKFIGGGTVTTGDVVPDGSGKQEVIVGSGSGMRSYVRAFDVTLATPAFVREWKPFAEKFRGGVSVSAGRFDAFDNAADIVVAAGPGGNSQVLVLNGKPDNGQPAALRLFNAYAGTVKAVSPQSAVHVAVRDTNGDGIIDVILVGQGPDGKSKQLKKLAINPAAIDLILERDVDFSGQFNLG